MQIKKDIRFFPMFIGATVGVILEIVTRSFAGYTLSAFLEQKDYGNRNLTAMSFNRSSFFVKYSQD